MSHYVSSRMSARPGGGGQNTQRQIIKSVDAWKTASSLLQDSTHVMGVYKAALHGDANLLMHIVTAEGLHLINQQDQLGIPPMIYATLSDSPACIERIQELGELVTHAVRNKFVPRQGFIQLSKVIRLNGRHHFSTRLDSFLYMFYTTRLSRRMPRA